MKKKTALILAIFLAAGVAGCTSNQTQPEQEPDSEVTTEAVEDTESDSEESSSETQEEKTEDTESTEEESAESQVTISYETLPDDRTLEDGTVIVTASYQRPTVTVEGNEDAAAAIKQEFDSDEEAFHIRVGEIETEAKAYFTEGTGEDVVPYANEVNYTDKRTDGRIISFERSNYSNLGGVHGNTYVSGLNFDTRTGARLILDDITEDKESFLATAKEYVLSLCESDAYKNRLMPGYEDYLNDILQDDLWYLDEEGITFIANTDTLAAYAEGTLQFTVPYENLNGLKAEYSK